MEKRRTPAQRRATAYHEAGHAVVFHYFGMISDEVSIVPGDDFVGTHTHAPPIMFEATTRERRSLARGMIVSCYAGLAAQRLVGSDAPDWCADSDEENAFYLSREYQVFPRTISYVGDEFHDRYLDRLRGEARRLVQRLRPYIAKLAEALLKSKKGKLSGKQVAKLLEGMPSH